MTVLRYSALNKVTQMKYTSEKCSISTRDCHMSLLDLLICQQRPVYSVYNNCIITSIAGYIHNKQVFDWFDGWLYGFSEQPSY